ncbi:MAG: bacteriohemerythrin [Coriobacteriia bacterium]
MDHFKWDPALETGVQLIDDQHRALFALANALQAAIRAETVDDDTVADALYGLTDYVTEHFADEEQLMGSRRYPDLAEHRDYHKQLTTEVLSLMAAYFAGAKTVGDRIAPLLTDWLRTHIAREDMSFVAWEKAR